MELEQCTALQPSSGSEHKSSTKKRTKAGVLVSDITREDLERCFHLPTERACVKLGVGLTILKRLCRKFGIARWPYRSLLKAGKAQRMTNLPAPADSSPLPSPHMPAPSVCVTPAHASAAHQPSASVSTHTSQSEAASEASNRPTSSQTALAAAAALPASAQAAASRSWATLAAALAPPAPLLPPSSSAALPPLAMPPIKTSVHAPFPASKHAPFPATKPRGSAQQEESELGVLLSAIDACEAQASADLAPADLAPARLPSSMPSTSMPPTPVDSAFLQPQAPWTPQASCQMGLPLSTAGPHHRAFSHSTRSAFRPVARRPQPAAGAPAAAAEAMLQVAEAVRAQLARRLALLQEAQAQASVSVPSAATTMLHALGAADLDERRRLHLAEKLLLVRAALQARIARRRAAQAAAAGTRFSPYATAELPPAQAHASSPVPIASLSPLSSADSMALAQARHLLSQYQL